MALTKIKSTSIKENTIPDVEALERIVETNDTHDYYSWKNRIINGNLTSWRAGTSFSASYDSSLYSYNAADMFAVVTQNCITTERSTDTPTESQIGFDLDYSMKFSVVSTSNSNFIGFATGVEPEYYADMKFGESGTRYATLSFWVKSSVTGTYGIELCNNASSQWRENTSNSTNRIYGIEYTISSANTWEKKTITFLIDSVAYDASQGSYLWVNPGLTITWGLSAGSNVSKLPSSSTGSWSSYTNRGITDSQANLVSTTGNTFYIAGIQLESGDSATNLQEIDEDETLMRCCKYYNKLGFAVGSLSKKRYWNFPTHMRSKPSITGGTGITNNMGIMLYENTSYSSDMIAYSFITSVQKVL